MPEVKPALGWTRDAAATRSDTLAAALLEPDDENSGKLLKVAAKVGHEKGKTILFDLKQLQRSLKFATGKDLCYFLPSYFKTSVYSITAGCSSSWSLEPWDERPLLRIVGDRERSQNALQCFLLSRLRTIELSDPHHILWRVAQLGIEHAGFKSIVAALTVAMNAWKGLRCIP